MKIPIGNIAIAIIAWTYFPWQIALMITIYAGDIVLSYKEPKE